MSLYHRRTEKSYFTTGSCLRQLFTAPHTLSIYDQFDVIFLRGGDITLLPAQTIYERDAQRQRL